MGIPLLSGRDFTDQDSQPSSLGSTASPESGADSGSNSPRPSTESEGGSESTDADSGSSAAHRAPAAEMTDAKGTPATKEPSTPAVIISARLAQLFWPGGKAVGRKLSMAGQTDEIVAGRQRL
jgi:hypothetical protein